MLSYYSVFLIRFVLLLQAFQVAISQLVASMLRKGPRFLIRMAHTFQPHILEEEKGPSCLSQIAAPLLTPRKVPPFFLKFRTLLIHWSLLWPRTGGGTYPMMAVLLSHLQSLCWYTLPNSWLLLLQAVYKIQLFSTLTPSCWPLIDHLYLHQNFQPLPQCHHCITCCHQHHPQLICLHHQSHLSHSCPLWWHPHPLCRLCHPLCLLPRHFPHLIH